MARGWVEEVRGTGLAAVEIAAETGDGVVDLRERKQGTGMPDQHTHNSAQREKSKGSHVRCNAY